MFSGIVAALRHELPALWSTAISATAWAGLIYLVVMGSFVAYLCFNWLTTVQPPAIVSTHTYVNPVIAVTIGWLVAAERVSGNQVIAFVIVISGVLITQLNKQRMVS